MKKSEALKILGLQDGASDDEVKKAHRKLVIENHPDKFGQDEKARSAAEEKTKMINEARDTLLSRKWDPEYATAGTPYGAPFSYQPYTRPTGGQANGQDPFAGTPFEGMNFVWTAYDAQGNPHAYRPGSGAGADQNPFAGADPFGFANFVRPVTPEEQLAKEKKALKEDLIWISVKTVIFIACCIFGLPAMGLYLYTVISIAQGIYKRLKVLGYLLLVPFIIMALPLMPVATTPIGFFAAFFFFIAVGFDVGNIRKHLRIIKTLKSIT